MRKGTFFTMFRTFMYLLWFVSCDQMKNLKPQSRFKRYTCLAHDGPSSARQTRTQWVTKGKR